MTRDDDDSPLPECRQQFNHIERMLEVIGGDLKSILESNIRHDESLKGVWHEIRSLKEEMKGVRTEAASGLKSHEDGCIPRKMFLKRATTPVRMKSPVAAPHKLSKKMVALLSGVGAVLAAAAALLKEFGVF